VAELRVGADGSPGCSEPFRLGMDPMPQGIRFDGRRTSPYRP